MVSSQDCEDLLIQQKFHLNKRRSNLKTNSSQEEENNGIRPSPMIIKRSNSFKMIRRIKERSKETSRMKK